MARFNLTVAGGLLAALGWAGVASAQTGGGMATVGAYPTPPAYNQGAGSYVVAPGLPGSGGTYGYVQQNQGARMGMSPNAYYSQNYFTSTPMTTGAPNAYSYSSRYTSP